MIKLLQILHLTGPILMVLMQRKGVRTWGKGWLTWNIESLQEGGIV